jgi:dTDP-4-dehydrorhamnose reductase
VKLLISGARGQLGSELADLARDSGAEVIALGRDELDFLEPGAVTERIALEAADWVINCAAYTQVDRAEQESETAFRVNRDAACAVAEGVKRYSGRLLHISTDFIFDGNSHLPYEEGAIGNPLSVYGQSKWEGEQGVLKILSDALVLRTAWVYGNSGNNFVKTMLKLASERDELRVVDDQIGTPSWTLDIARAVLALIGAEVSGIYHFTNEGVASWYDFADQTIEIARGFGFPLRVDKVQPIPSCDYPTPALRPSYSVMSKRKIRSVLGYAIPHWRLSLRRMLEREMEEWQKARS